MLCFNFILKLILAKEAFLEHYNELSDVMAVTSNRLSIAKQLHDNNLITKDNFDEASREDDTKSGMERGSKLMKTLKSLVRWPSKRYFCQVMYEIITPGREWLMMILLCKDYDALLQVYTCMHALSL